MTSTTTTARETSEHPACDPCETTQTAKKTNAKSKNRRKKTAKAKDCPTGDCGMTETTNCSNGFDIPVGETGAVFHSVWRFGE